MNIATFTPKIDLQEGDKVRTIKIVETEDGNLRRTSLLNDETASREQRKFLGKEGILYIDKYEFDDSVIAFNNDEAILLKDYEVLKLSFFN